MEQTECSETSAYKIQEPGNYPEESKQHSEHGDSLKSRIKVTMFWTVSKGDKPTVERFYLKHKMIMKSSSFVWLEGYTTHRYLARLLIPTSSLLHKYRLNILKTKKKPTSILFLSNK